MKTSLFEGAGVALVTPMKNGMIDYDAMGNLIDFQIENHTDALVICGTTGEAPTLDDGEHLDAIEYAVSRAGKRVPVIAGTGSNNTEHAVMMSREAEKRGVDGFLWVTPYYNKATQNGLYEHYKRIAMSCNLPGIMYNVPSRTGVNLLPETVEKLSEIDNIVAIKEASGRVDQTVDIIDRCGDKIDVYSGEDGLIVPLMSVGAKGVISVLSNVVPAETHDICDLCLNGNFAEGAKLQLKYNKLIKALFSEVNPIPVKAALNIMGLIDDEIRLPLCHMENKNYENLKKQLSAVGII